MNANAIDSTTTPKLAGPSAPVTIKRLHIDSLFGQYTYNLPGGEDSFDETVIIYGENGTGKTNVLKILFHLLSPAHDRGHRTALGQIKFRRVDVTLSNQIEVCAIREKERLDGAIRLEVNRVTSESRTLLGLWNWAPKHEPQTEQVEWRPSIETAQFQTFMAQWAKTSVSASATTALIQALEESKNPVEGEAIFLKALAENVPPVYFLPADRTFLSDKIERRNSGYIDHEMRTRRPEELMAIAREMALDDAISSTSRRLSQLGVRATRQGSTSMHSIYQGLIRRLASRSSAASKTKKKAGALKTLTAQLERLSTRYELYAEYGLAPNLRVQELVKLLEAVRPAERAVAAEVLHPYVESLTKQADSLQQAYGITDVLLRTINDFLRDKLFAFSLGEGMTVSNKNDEALKPKDLSSGEQNLILLMCHITLAHDTGAVFLIDEPEISLNIKWQRKLVDSLVNLDMSKSLQFVFASHSMEILAKHRESVVTLRTPEND
jgi:energy-coupling factor transporter ATP-binding protein EcfA2